jgi:predicted hydrocarbon binding protein
VFLVRLRKQVNVYLHHPSRKLFHLVVELKNVPGALHDVLGVIRDLNLNILGSFYSADSAASTGVWSGFVEDSHHTAAELKEKLSSSQLILDSIVIESKEGFLVDATLFPIALNTGEKAVMMEAGYLGRMLAAVRKRFGTGGESIIHEEGQGYGRDAWTHYVTMLGSGFLRSNLQDVLKLYQALGWFKLEGVDWNDTDRSVTVRTRGNFECEGAKSSSPYSHFVRGHLAGGLTAIMGKEMACEETKCIAVGDEYCEFVLRPRAGAGQSAKPIGASAR